MPRRKRHFQDMEEKQKDEISKRRVNLKGVPKLRPWRVERCSISKLKIYIYIAR